MLPKQLFCIANKIANSRLHDYCLAIRPLIGRSMCPSALAQCAKCIEGRSILKHRPHCPAIRPRSPEQKSMSQTLMPSRRTSMMQVCPRFQRPCTATSPLASSPALLLLFFLPLPLSDATNAASAAALSVSDCCPAVTPLP